MVSSNPFCKGQPHPSLFFFILEEGFNSCCKSGVRIVPLGLPPAVILSLAGDGVHSNPSCKGIFEDVCSIIEHCRNPHVFAHPALPFEPCPPSDAEGAVQVREEALPGQMFHDLLLSFLEAPAADSDIIFVKQLSHGQLILLCDEVVFPYC